MPSAEAADTPLARKNFHIFGNGISFSISPTIHNAGFNHHCLPYHYDIRESPCVDDVAHLIKRDEFGGASVTMPHKLQAHRYCDQLTETARVIGAVNTLIPRGEGPDRILLGDNTDWSGLYSIITDYLKASQVAPSTALVIGAGGASRAAIYALHRAGFQTIYIVNRTMSVAIDVQRSFENHFEITVLPHLDSIPKLPVVVIGTVPADKTTEQQFSSIFGLEGLCIDMAYKPRQTPLLAVAQRYPRWKTVTGIEVLLAQAFDQYQLWTGREAPKEIMVDAVLGRLSKV
ncbi:uncharacterized protein E0L32_001075 [Thyridium curvatum]|uniref:Shikimate dehydrogenase n=1 Tax=Thyridium curvatum TaxID=1093900 RepID=A0A507AUU1_9PEZI|nr:uncharacterized protein E0L32_001075 [Thyridium curvatum]TPX11257.1 hypothetical protein E0L32_001075 [Thyridium curvatum]